MPERFRKVVLYWEVRKQFFSVMQGFCKVFNEHKPGFALCTEGCLVGHCFCSVATWAGKINTTT